MVSSYLGKHANGLLHYIVKDVRKLMCMVVYLDSWTDCRASRFLLWQGCKTKFVVSKASDQVMVK